MALIDLNPKKLTRDKKTSVARFLKVQTPPVIINESIRFLRVNKIQLLASVLVAELFPEVLF